MVYTARTISTLNRMFLGLTLTLASVWIASAVAQAGVHLGSDETVWPDTYAGRWAQAYFDAYNTDGEGALESFIEAHYSASYLEETPVYAEMANHRLLQAVAGTIRVHSASAQGEYSVDALVHLEHMAIWAKFRIELSDTPPHDLVQMGPYSMASAPAESVSAPESEPVPGAGHYHDWTSLRSLAEQVRRDTGAPALAVAIVRGGSWSGGGIEKVVLGVRRVDRSEAVEAADRFHLGSVAKTFTGLMIARLVDHGVLQWNTTIGSVLPDVPMKPAYLDVTVEQLLLHRGGVPSMVGSGEFAPGAAIDIARPPVVARAALARRFLNEESTGAGQVAYSNAGVVIAAHLAERGAGRPWEELVRTLVLEPLELRSAVFDWPAAEGHPQQPYGHYGLAPDLRVQEIGACAELDMKAFGPAGHISLSIDDFARYAGFHLDVLNGRSEALQPESVPRYWSVGGATDGQPVYSHFGSGGTFMAMIAVYPVGDFAVVAVTNNGLAAMEPLERMRDGIYRRITDDRQPSEEAGR